MTEQHNPLAAKVAKWRAEATDKRTGDSSAAYLAAEALEFAADELEAEMAKMCDGANAPCKPSNRFPDRCKQHGRITEESIERGGHFNRLRNVD